MTIYLTLNQVMHIAEEVTGVPLETLARVTQLPLLASAVAIPQTQLIGLDPYPELSDKAAVLALHIAKNHALPDGNKRLAFLSAFEFCWINGFEMEFDVDEAEEIFFGLAAGELSLEQLSSWVKGTLTPRE
jgi:death-on-curing protein